MTYWNKFTRYSKGGGVYKVEMQTILSPISSRSTKEVSQSPKIIFLFRENTPITRHKLISIRPITCNLEFRIDHVGACYLTLVV